MKKQKVNRTSEKNLTQKKWIILLDHYLLCDVLFDRSTYYQGDIDRLLYLITLGEIKAYITEVGFNEIFSLSKKFHTSEQIEKLRTIILPHLSICKIDNQVISKAILYREGNFKTAIDTTCQKTYKIDFIVTMSQDFSLIEQEMSKDLPVYNPSDFLGHYYNYYNSNFKLIQKNNMIYQIQKLERNFQFSPDTINDAKPCIGNWIIENYYSESMRNQDSRAKITLWNPQTQEQRTEVAQAPGTFEALSKAFDKAVEYLGIFPERYELESIFDKNIEQGSCSRVSATSIIKYQNELYKSVYTHRDSVKAKFYAYVFAVNNIYKGEKHTNFTDTELSKKVKRIINVLFSHADIQLDDEELELTIAFCHYPNATLDEIKQIYELPFETQALENKFSQLSAKLRTAISKTKQGIAHPVKKIDSKHLAEILEQYQLPLDGKMLDIMSHLKSYSRYLKKSQNS